MLQEDIYLARMQDPLQEMVYFLANLAKLYSCKMALILHVSCFLACILQISARWFYLGSFILLSSHSACKVGAVRLLRTV